MLCSDIKTRSIFNFKTELDLVLDFLDDVCDDVLEIVDGDAVTIVVMILAGIILIWYFDDNTCTERADFVLDEDFCGVIGSANIGDVFNATLMAPPSSLSLILIYGVEYSLL